MLDLLIVGGGVHGTYLSSIALDSGVPADRLRVLDPHAAPLARFWEMTAATGMRFLRSPAVHHLGRAPHALRSFARTAAGRRHRAFLAPYDRPGLALFRAHVETLVREQRLDSLRVPQRAVALRRRSQHWEVDTPVGTIGARRVILALGLSEQLNQPDWASRSECGDRVRHLFAPGCEPVNLAADWRTSANQDCPSSDHPIVVVGGGISAAQVSCLLADAGHPVVLVRRHAERIHRFDSDPIWLGPAGMAGFRRTSDPIVRRSMIAGARRRGSMPPDVRARLLWHQRSGRIVLLESSIERAAPHLNGVRLELTMHGPLEAAGVLLATGLDGRRPGGQMIDQVIATEGLPCAPCGYPVVSQHLEWSSGLHVTGPLAEMELGPTARNIAGARAAGERLAALWR